MATPTSTAERYAVSLDIGSSSVRALLFDTSGRQMEGYGAQLPYHIHTTPDGGAEADPEELSVMAFDCLDEVHRQVHESRLGVVAVAGSAFLHGLMGVGEDGRVTVPLMHLFDTRGGDFLANLPDASARTGCPTHASYWPGKLLWLAATRPDEFAATRHWMSFAEFLFGKVCGRTRSSTSMSSATGIWNQRAGDYDAEMLSITGVRREQLANPLEMDLLEKELLPEHRRRWPGLEGAAWFPLIGDGQANNIGSGCVTPDVFALMVGTTGAMRVIVETQTASATRGLWCYRLDRTRAVVGGALSNGGEVSAWMKRTLALPRDIEARLDKALPGTHGLHVLPFFAGERTPYWRSDLKASITGLTFTTEAFDIYRAFLEAVALGFREVYRLLCAAMHPPATIIASGGALLRSPGWTQMMADALGRAVTASTEPEASARGAALWAFEQLGLISSLGTVAASNGATFEPRPERVAAFDRMEQDRNSLYAKLYGAESNTRDKHYE